MNKVGSLLGFGDSCDLRSLKHKRKKLGGRTREVSTSISDLSEENGREWREKREKKSKDTGGCCASAGDAGWGLYDPFDLLYCAFLWYFGSTGSSDSPLILVFRYLFFCQSLTQGIYFSHEPLQSRLVLYTFGFFFLLAQ